MKWYLKLIGTFSISMVGMVIFLSIINNKVTIALVVSLVISYFNLKDG